MARRRRNPQVSSEDNRAGATFQAFRQCSSSRATHGGITVDAEILVPSAKIPELSKAVYFTPGAGRNIAIHALPAARMSAFLIPAFPVHSTPFHPNPLPL